MTLFFGTAVYNGSIPFARWDEVPSEDDDETELLDSGKIKKNPLMHTPTSMTSAALTRSPLIRRQPPVITQSSLPNQYGSMNN